MEPRHYTNLVLEKLDLIADVDKTIISLLNYMSDDDVRDWAIANEILDPDEGEETSEEYIAEYYYEPHDKLWRADIKDENDNVVDFMYAPDEESVKFEIKYSDYNIIRSTKTSFYK